MAIIHEQIETICGVTDQLISVVCDDMINLQIEINPYWISRRILLINNPSLVWIAVWSVLTGPFMANIKD